GASATGASATGAMSNAAGAPTQPALRAQSSVATAATSSTSSTTQETGSDIAPRVGPPDTAVAPSSEAPASRDHSGRDERDLVESMRGGSISASEELLKRYRQEHDRSHDAVNVCLRLTQARPGDTAALERLIDAAVADDDAVLIGALRHAQRIFTDPGRAPIAPSLAQQPVVPDGLLKLLCGGAQPVLEVLALVLQSLPQLLRRPANLEPDVRAVSPESLMPLGQLTAMVARLFGVRVPVLHLDGPRPVQFHVFVDPAPKLLVQGPDLADTPDFRFHFGGMVLATRPEFALMLALPEDEVR